MTENQTPVAEIVRFRAQPGLDPATLLEAAKGTRAALAACPGFRSRHLTCDETGLWCDFVLWDNMAAARAGADAMMRHPDFAPFIATIDLGSIEMRHDRLIWSMGG